VELARENFRLLFEISMRGRARTPGDMGFEMTRAIDLTANTLVYQSPSSPVRFHTSPEAGRFRRCRTRPRRGALRANQARLTEARVAGHEIANHARTGRRSRPIWYMALWRLGRYRPGRAMPADLGRRKLATRSCGAPERWLAA